MSVYHVLQKIAAMRAAGIRPAMTRAQQELMREKYGVDIEALGIEVLDEVPAGAKLLCRRVSEGPANTGEVDVLECGECGAKVWADKTRPEGIAIFCNSCSEKEMELLTRPVEGVH